MEKQDFNRLMEHQLSEIKEDFLNKKPTLLLHACCAPCSSFVLERLAEVFSITIYYYNPNIHPQNEYDRRIKELDDFIHKFSLAKNINLIVPKYIPEEYFEATNVLKEEYLRKEAERGERCFRCYNFRMKKAYEFAVENNFDYFTTTLSISPHKDAKKINFIGEELEKNFMSQKNSTKYLFADFKKKNGFKRSLEISTEYGLYRQDYCGCVFSAKTNLNQL